MRFPTTNDIEAFVVAANHMNFTKAGETLNLTSSAISQRILALEQELGFKLFRRHGPKLILTEEGEISLPVLRQTLAQYRESIGSLQSLIQSRALTLQVSPSFAEKWLNPRLATFEERHPDIDLRIWSTVGGLNMKMDRPGLSVSYGINPSDGVPADHSVELLFAEHIFPVCAPEYLASCGPLNGLDDLGKMKLLHDDNMEPMRSFPNWRRWCARFKVNQVDTSRGPRFNISSMVLNAAIEGRGIALGRGALVYNDLEKGRLVRPFPEIFPLSFEYYLVYPRSLNDRPDFEPCRAWLVEEAAKQRSFASL